MGLRLLCESLESRSECVEIGCFLGEDTAVFAEYFNTVHAIDPWDFQNFEELTVGGLSHGSPISPTVAAYTGSIIEGRFDENMLPFSNVVKMKSKACDVVDEFKDGSVDMLYIDSIHTFEYLLTHVNNWWEKISHGGVLAGHDYRSMFPEVCRAVDLISKLTGKRPNFYTDSSWSFIKD
jgi:hypothetical protein